MSEKISIERLKKETFEQSCLTFSKTIAIVMKKIRKLILDHRYQAAVALLDHVISIIEFLEEEEQE